MLNVKLFGQYPISRKTIVVIHDIAAIVVAFPIAVMLRENSLLDGGRFFYILSCLPLLVVAALLAITILGSHRAIWRYMGTGEIVGLSQLALMAVLLFYLGQFLVDRLDSLPRSAPPIHFLVAMFFLLGTRIAYGEYCRHVDAGARPHDRQSLLLVGSGDGAALFIQMLASRPDRAYDVVGILSDQISRDRSIAGVPVLGGLADFDAVLANLRVQGMLPSRLVITRPHHELGRDAVHHLMKHAYAGGIKVEQLPDIMRFKGEAVGPAAPAVPAAKPAAFYPRFKRGFDMAVSASVLLFLLPLLLVSAIAVALFIGRPVLFTQRRPGLNRREFTLYKFRSMRDPLDATGRVLTDAERTPLTGRILRRTRLDELPQFWNVLLGDMAIIGPRPLIREDLAAMPDRGKARCRIRPGITGWAQVNGGQQLAPDEKLALDLWYAANSSLALDARIVWRTIIMMLMGERRAPDAIKAARAAIGPLPEAAE